jgi:hypothetical protein
MLAYVVKQPAPGHRPGFTHWGQAPLSNRARARRSEGSGQCSTALGIRLSGGLSRATKSSLLASPSVFQRMVLSPILRTGLRVGPNRSSPTPRGSVERQPTGRWGLSEQPCGQGSRSHNLGRVEGSPTSVQPQVQKPRQCASTQQRLIEICCP